MMILSHTFVLGAAGAPPSPHQGLVPAPPPPPTPRRVSGAWDRREVVVQEMTGATTASLSMNPCSFIVLLWLKSHSGCCLHLHPVLLTLRLLALF